MWKSSVIILLVVPFSFTIYRFSYTRIETENMSAEYNSTIKLKTVNWEFGEKNQTSNFRENWVYGKASLPLPLFINWKFYTSRNFSKKIIDFALFFLSLQKKSKFHLKLKACIVPLNIQPLCSGLTFGIFWKYITGVVRIGSQGLLLGLSWKSLSQKFNWLPCFQWTNSEVMVLIRSVTIAQVAYFYIQWFYEMR